MLIKKILQYLVKMRNIYATIHFSRKIVSPLIYQAELALMYTFSFVSYTPVVDR